MEIIVEIILRSSMRSKRLFAASKNKQNDASKNHHQLLGVIQGGIILESMKIMGMEVTCTNNPNNTLTMHKPPATLHMNMDVTPSSNQNLFCYCNIKLQLLQHLQTLIPNWLEALGL